MKKDLKLNLENLKVQSFVTSLNSKNAKTIGGAQAAVSLNKTCPIDCTWYSELGTACSCPPSEWEPCSLVRPCLAGIQ